jgi:hypothetical protein
MYEMKLAMTASGRSGNVCFRLQLFDFDFIYTMESARHGIGVNGLPKGRFEPIREKGDMISIGTLRSPCAARVKISR